ncbi:SDR family oxidoreductase [Ornithinimicrobium sufpigmenti]|uniref:SDR family oxidoreductase n=1 Tax=Ornithinimicrobium sufpigmenti TaxID=2508882 RepID=UPI00192D3B29|nr:MULTISPECIES: SDR family oxidoreductase [unclassified Ornithinimicrobium]
MTQLSALVTGATRGIGRGIADHLAGAGYALTIAARRADALAAAADELRDLGAPRVETVAADMADADAVETVLARHREAYGSLNALVLAAGVGSAAPLEGYPMRRYDKQLAVNARSAFQLVTGGMDLLRAGAQSEPERASRILALSSVEGLYPEEGLAAYGASKAALIALMQSVNVEVGQHGVTGTAISPAYVDTEMSDWVADRVPKESMIRVADVVAVVSMVLAASRTASFPHIVINRTGASPYQA